jgi:hypothetical protein
MQDDEVRCTRRPGYFRPTANNSASFLLKYLIMKKCLFLLLLTPLFIKTSAQNDNMTYDPNKALMVTIGAGAGYNDYKHLNNRLDDAGILTVGKFSISNMLEADMRMKNLLIGLGTGMNLSAKKNDDYKTWLMSFYGGAHAAYYVANSKNFHFGPQLGIGAYGSFVKITERNGHNNFNDLITSGNSTTISQYTPALDFALRFDFADFSKSKTGVAGLRLGYRLGLSNRGWGDDAGTSVVDGSPKDRIGQFYAMATIGLTALKPNNWRGMKNMH